MKPLCHVSKQRPVATQR